MPVARESLDPLRPNSFEGSFLSRILLPRAVSLALDMVASLAPPGMPHCIPQEGPTFLAHHPLEHQIHHFTHQGSSNQADQPTLVGSGE